MQKTLLIITLIFLTSCGKDMFTFPSTRDVPTDIKDRVEKNIEEGRGISFGGEKKKVVFLTLLHQMKWESIN